MRVLLVSYNFTSTKVEDSINHRKFPNDSAGIELVSFKTTAIYLSIYLSNFKTNTVLLKTTNTNLKTTAVVPTVANEIVLYTKMPI